MSPARILRPVAFTKYSSELKVIQDVRSIHIFDDLIFCEVSLTSENNISEIYYKENKLLDEKNFKKLLNHKKYSEIIIKSISNFHVNNFVLLHRDVFNIIKNEGNFINNENLRNKIENELKILYLDFKTLGLETTKLGLENFEDYKIAYINQSDGYIYDLKGNAFPMAIELGSICGLTEKYYDLNQLISELNKNKEIKFIKNKNGEIIHIDPETEEKYISIKWIPTDTSWKDIVDKFHKTKNKNRMFYNSDLIQLDIFDIEKLKISNEIKKTY